MIVWVFGPTAQLNPVWLGVIGDDELPATLSGVKTNHFNEPINQTELIECHQGFDHYALVTGMILQVPWL